MVARFTSTILLSGDMHGTLFPLLIGCKNSSFYSVKVPFSASAWIPIRAYTARAFSGVILNNAHFRTNAMRMGWLTFLFTSVWFPVWSGPGFNGGLHSQAPPSFWSYTVQYGNEEGRNLGTTLEIWGTCFRLVISYTHAAFVFHDINFIEKKSRIPIC